MDAKEKILKYDIEALKNNIEKCKKNVKVFEKAIKKEYDTIARYKSMIAVLEEHQRSGSTI